MNNLLTGQDFLKGVITDIRQRRLPQVGAMPQSNRGAKIGEIHYWKDGNRYQKTIHGWVPVGHSGLGLSHSEWGQHFHPEAWGQPAAQKEPTPVPVPEPVQELAPAAPASSPFVLSATDVEAPPLSHDPQLSHIPEPELSAPELTVKDTRQRLEALLSDIHAVGGFAAPQKGATPEPPAARVPKAKKPIPKEATPMPLPPGQYPQPQVINPIHPDVKGFMLDPAAKLAVTAPHTINNYYDGKQFLGFHLIDIPTGVSVMKNPSNYVLVPRGVDVRQLAQDKKDKANKELGPLAKRDLENDAKVLDFAAQYFTDDTGKISEDAFKHYSPKSKMTVKYPADQKKILNNMKGKWKHLRAVGKGFTAPQLVEFVKGKTVAIAKTSWERGGGGWWDATKHIRHGNQAHEAAAYVLANLLGFNNTVPPTIFEGEKKDASWIQGGKDKKGTIPPMSYQHFIPLSKDKDGKEIPDSVKMLDVYTNGSPAGKGMKNAWDNISPESMFGVLVLDLLGANIDRHNQNIMVKLNSNTGKWDAIAIDNASLFYGDYAPFSGIAPDYFTKGRYEYAVPEHIINRLNSLTVDDLHLHIGGYLAHSWGSINAPGGKHWAGEDENTQRNTHNIHYHYLEPMVAKAKVLAGMVKRNGGVLTGDIVTRIQTRI